MSFGPFGNPTQALGFCSFAAAAVCCTLASRSGGAARRAWAVMAAIHAVLLIEVLIEWRYAWHDVIAAWMMGEGAYGDRRPLQAGMIALLLVVFVVAWIRWRPDRVQTATARIAAWATAFAVVNFMIESISLHQIDAVLYRPVGPVLLNGLLWAAACLVTSACALAKVNTR